VAERDRDESGRPRSDRPRDALGRPLPQGSEGIPRIPDDLNLPPSETLTFAQDLLDRGLAFNAHEVLEAAWKNGPDGEKTLWQALAQLAVGITHVQRNNVKGAITVLRRTSGRLTLDETAPYDIDVAGLADYADVLIDDLAANAEITPDRLRPRLVVRPLDRGDSGSQCAPRPGPLCRLYAERVPGDAQRCWMSSCSDSTSVSASVMGQQRKELP
jgi:uncharacterized protein